MSLTLRPDWIVAWIPDVNLANALYSIPEPVVSLLYGSYVPDVSPINSLASTGFWNLAPYTLPTTGFSRTFCGTNLRVSSVLVLRTNPLIGSLAFCK